jgi:hypothetical protein
MIDFGDILNLTLSSGDAGVEGFQVIAFPQKLENRESEVEHEAIPLMSFSPGRRMSVEGLDGGEDEPLIEKKSKSLSAKLLTYFKTGCLRRCFPEEKAARAITFSAGRVKTDPQHFPPNLIRNQKYSVLTFLPIFLYEQFRFFFNLYFLLVACLQFVPSLQVRRDFSLLCV